MLFPLSLMLSPGGREPVTSRPPLRAELHLLRAAFRAARAVKSFKTRRNHKNIITTESNRKAEDASVPRR